MGGVVSWLLPWPLAVPAVSTNHDNETSPDDQHSQRPTHDAEVKTPSPTSRQENEISCVTSLLPSTINAYIALRSFQSQREALLNLIRHSLPSLTNSLWANGIIPQDIVEKVLNQFLSSSERGVILLDCIEAKLTVQPATYCTLVRVLESERYFERMGKQLVDKYNDYSSMPSTDFSSIASPAVLRYQIYLKSFYTSSSISRDSKDPPPPEKFDYVSLALAEYGETSRDNYIGHILKGNINEALQQRRAISCEEIFEDQKKTRLILIEGAPGIGKSTFAWELCRKWERGSPFMKYYSLVVLLRLREEEVQKISNVEELFCRYESKHKQALVDEVKDFQGGNVLFILDGFDELPKKLQQQGFILDLIKGRVLPESSTVLVTSRPSATADIIAACDPQKRIEILGFTQDAIDAYAEGFFGSNSADLERFKSYTSKSTNPLINSLMYIPLNAAIIVRIFCDVQSDTYLPQTLTEVYTELCLTILNRHLKVQQNYSVRKLAGLPTDLYQELLKLSEMAYTGMTEEKTIFNSVDPSLVHFGFLDAVPALYGGKVSYNFLHLTLQEFFAAYYLSQLPDCGLEIFRQYGHDERWNVVFRFVAGLTKFENYVDIADLFVVRQEGCRAVASLFFIHCCFEAKTTKFFNSFLSTNPAPLISIAVRYGTFFDLYSLGYCIANFAVGASWTINISNGVFSSKDEVNQSFVPGWKTKIPSAGIVKELHVSNHYAIDFASCTECPLQHIAVLSLTGCTFSNESLIQLAEALSHLTSLWHLNLFQSYFQYSEHQIGVRSLLSKLANSSVTSLNIQHVRFACFLEDNPPNDWYMAFKNLIDPEAGKLKSLIIGGNTNEEDGVLARLLATRSSLKTLNFVHNKKSLVLSCLKENPSLKKLIVNRMNPVLEKYPLSQIIDILENMNTLEHVCFGPSSMPRDSQKIKAITDAISNTASLQTLELVIILPNSKINLPDYMRDKNLTSDPRVVWIPNFYYILE